MSQAALITRLNELPRIQSLLQELLEMVNQEDVNFGALAKKISMDQVLSARLLRMANSAHFGGKKTIATINDALIRVGTGPVRTLVVASVLSSAFPRVKTLDMEKYWTDTFEVSVISSKLAAESGMDVNETFTTGVLHNIGELMIHTLVPEQALVINQRVAKGADPISVQEELLNVSSPTLGAKLARSWNFPEEMADAIEHFHEPREADVSPKLASIIHFARAINNSWDDFKDSNEKAHFLANHPDSRLLCISAAFVDQIDKIRGNGRDLAMQMVAA
ncbi:HDOD domain-containing protein [Vibrio vulnificus]|uniref:HDOD domain-containing protein n=1 Tax=Vibrio vulnificus TaxID=672 RepID=UPI001CDC6A4F|nr:HDOD domain-containing protein [Vibrio vulnificus]ELP5729622.1 HDOD domain-containing protein [Vibrio vulnificus]MCA3901350.1 HDOD domain-containing protein [Vibrio vulnificus]